MPFQSGLKSEWTQERMTEVMTDVPESQAC